MPKTGTILLKEANQMRFASACGHAIDKLRQLRMNFTDSFQHSTGIFDKPVIIQDTEAFNSLNTSPDLFKQFKDLGIRSSKSVITCPIILGDEVYGSINLDNFNHEKAFKDEDKPIISYLAKLISLALKNNMLVQETLYYTKHDMLTDAYTRIHYEALLEKTFDAAKASGTSFSLAILDINNMKTINDTLGHHAGDALLQYFCHQTKKLLKENHHLARFGGDEFTILFDDDDTDSAQAIINALKAYFATHPLTVDQQEITLVFGAGIASYPVDGDQPNALIRVADQRMYHDKAKQNTSF